MALHAIYMMLFGIAAYVWVGQKWSGTVMPHEQLRAALLVAFFLPVF